MAKKRKKKTYNTPKKIKSRNVNVPLQTLKYFEIIDGKIEHLREKCQVCNSFVAVHSDRTHCGFCNM